MEVKQGYKPTEAGLIPEDWNVQPLGSVVTFLDGQRRPVKDADRAKMRGSIPYYGASGIVDYVNDYLFDEDLILLGEDGENILSRNTRLAFRISGKVWVNNHAHVLRPNQNINIGFLTDYLEALNYESLNSGTAQPKLNKQNCFGIPIALPPTLVEQEAIAEALSNADVPTEALEHLIAKKRQVKQGAMQELLTGKKRLPGFGNNKYKQTETGVIPEDWDVATLSSISKEPMQNGVFFKPSQKGRGVRLINVGDLYSQPPIDPETLELFDATNNEVERFRVKNGDLFFTRSSVVPSGIAHCNIYSSAKPQSVVFDSHVIRFRPDTSKVVSSYLFRFCVASTARRYLVSHAKTGTMTTIDQSVLGNCPIILPSLSEQTAIAEILSDMDAEIAALEEKLSKARQVKQGMMSMLLTGKIRLV